MTTPPPPGPEQPDPEPGPQQPGPQQPQYGQYPPAQPGYGAPAYGPRQGSAVGLPPTSDEKTWAWISHAGSIVAAGVAMAFLAPLVIMLVKGNESPFVRRHAVESLNFQITTLIYAAISVVLVFVLVGFLLLVALAVFWLVCVVLGTIKAANGEDYRYPLTIRLVS